MTKEEFIRRAVNRKNNESDIRSFIVRGLESYREQFYEDPSLNWPENEFENRCVSIWVFDELIFRIRSRVNEVPFTIAERFIIELIGCMRETDIRERERIFRMASCVAEEIADYMHCMF